MAASGRTLILCFDGTTNEFGTDNTNVIKFFQLLKKDDPGTQLVYYQPGIGTYERPGMTMGIYLKISEILDEAFAWYLDAHIMGGYSFLMQHYRKGDRICLFGFSRGAYTARCLAGMLHKVGLLPISNKEQISFAYRNYTDYSTKGWKQSAAFKQAFSISVDIEFVGCWETVSSVGVIFSRHLPFSTANTIIRKFRHALALDEHRVRFQPNLWHKEPEDERDLSSARAIDPEHSTPPKIKDGETGLMVEIQDPCVTGGGRPKSKTDVKEVWFAGCHSDVGGGSVPNNTPHSLAFVPFRWMVEQTILCQTGILYLPGALHSIGLTADPFIEARTNSSQLDGGIESYLNDSKVVSDNIDQSDPQAVAKKGKASTSDTNGEAGGTIFQHQSREQEETQVEREIKGEAQAARNAIKSSNLSLRRLDPTKGQRQHGSEDTQVQFTSVERPELPNSPSNDFITGPLEPPHNVENELDAERQAHDLRSKIYDPLKTKPAWWILEVIPMFNPYMDCNGRWHQTFGANFGRPRKIKSEEGPYLHVTVKERMESGIGYKPRARLMEGIDKARWTQ
ncbi:hypothetical protein FRB96_005153 [Tulasnella sp. 330]|nr:hypothetical protein FRB96_005153 [Tulasnella sp. 330]